MFPYLGASPDALMMDVNQEPILIEIKTAFNPKNLILEDLYEERSDFCLTKNVNGQFELKKTHRYYYQIQGQLGVAHLQTCLFVFHFSKTDNMHIEKITFDIDGWATTLCKLRQFYFDHYLPHLCSIL